MVHQIEPCSSNEHFENEAKTEESEYWIRDILHEILKRIPEIPGIKPINTCIPKPRKLEAGRSPRLRIKSTQLGNNRAGSTTITPPPKLKSLSKVKAAIAKINSEPSEPIVFGTKRSITPTAVPSAYKPELAKSSTSELPQSSLQGTKSIATLSAGPTANKTELTQSSLHCIPLPQTPTLSNIGIRGLQIPSLQTFPTINMVLKPPPSPILIPPARNKNLLAQHTHPPTHPTTQVSKMDPGLKQVLIRQRIKSEGAVPDIKNVKKSQEVKKTGGSSVKKRKKEDTEKLKKATMTTMKMSSRMTSWLKKADNPKDE